MQTQGERSNGPVVPVVPAELFPGVGIGVQEWEQRKRFVRFGPADAVALAGLAPLVARHADSIVDRFYDNLSQSEHLGALIDASGSTVERLKVTQRQYLLELFSGDYGENYLRRRIQVGVVHHRIGLSPQWYLGSFSIYTQALLPIIRRHLRWSGRRLEQALLALDKLLSLDAQIAIDIYIYRMFEELQQASLSRERVDRQMADYRRFVARVATGDLTQHLAVEGNDELASLGDQLNHMTDNLADIARQVSEASASVMVAVAQLQHTMSAQSAGAAEQASAVNQTATTLEEIRATSNQTRDKARTLSQAADRTREEGERGQAIVQRSVDAMADIRGRVESIAKNILALSEQNQQVGEITTLVSGIAQQLKILALNAAIEASKVGEAGRGFAVVAAEVRNLAEQSQEATGQIHSILQEIQRATDRSVMATEEGTKGVDQGMALVEQAGAAMRDLTRVIRETAVAGQQIVAAVGQEAAGIDQIAAAMRDINGATNQFVSTTAQTRQTTEELSAVAGRLRDRAAVYKVQR